MVELLLPNLPCGKFSLQADKSQREKGKEELSYVLTVHASEVTQQRNSFPGSEEGMGESRNVMQWMFLNKDENLWRGHIGPLSLVKLLIPYSLLCPPHIQRQGFV